ncbi:MAG: hypothetical protein ACYC1U_05020 [Candidatus Aquicultorales bacterium]
MLKNLLKAKDLLSHVVNLRESYMKPVRLAVVEGEAIGNEIARDALEGAVKLVRKDALEPIDFSVVDLVVRMTRPGEAVSREERASYKAAGDLLIVVDATATTSVQADRALWSLPKELMDRAQVVGEDGDVKSMVVRKILERLDDKKVALARAIPAFRAVVAKDVITKTSLQNGGIATVAIIPGADMPLLTANQIKMALELTAIYGVEPSLAKLKELLAVVGAGFVFRTIAREALGFIPGPGWIIKGGVAVGGTIVMGKAIQAYLERGKGEDDEPLASNREIVAAGGETGPLH